MQKTFLAVVVCILSTGHAMAQSIDFAELSYQQALEKSASSGKLIFIDCYTSWCAPCKQMDKTVFTIDSVYEFYNGNFINLKIDMEKGEGVALRKKYSVASFPTYLFINSLGEIIHRTASLMPAGEFLAEARKALDPNGSYVALKKRYESGERSNALLFNYVLATRKVNRQQSDSIEKLLRDALTDQDLQSAFGWQVIKELSMNEQDRFGKYFLDHLSQFVALAGEAEANTVKNRLKMNSMYRLIRDKDSAGFFRELQTMKTDHSEANQSNVAMLEMEYYLEVHDPAAFVAVAETAAAGPLKFDDRNLSFIARRALYKAAANKLILLQALQLARQAVRLNPTEYSNQGTLASICLELKLKKEGVKAAREARKIANESTSKIQKIAQDLLDQIEALPD